MWLHSHLLCTIILILQLTKHHIKKIGPYHDGFTVRLKNMVALYLKNITVGHKDVETIKQHLKDAVDGKFDDVGE